MKKQIAAWRREYLGTGPERIESSVSFRPEPSVLWFREQMRERGLGKGKILDLGCGRGRNSLTFLKQGWQVEGVDAVRKALRDFKFKAGKRAKSLRLHCRDFQRPLPFPDRYFEAVMEITAADNLVNIRARYRFWREACRVLKSGGWFFSYHFTPRDGYYGPLLRQARTRSRGLLYDPQGRMFFRFYGAGEIVKSTHGRLRLVASRKYCYPGPMFGRTYRRDLHAILLQKQED